MCVLRHCFNNIYDDDLADSCSEFVSARSGRTFNKYKDSTFQKQRSELMKRPHRKVWPNRSLLMTPDQRLPDLEERPLVAPFVLAVFLGEAFAV